MRWRAGELDQRITIKREQLTSDEYGGQTVALNTILQCWAKVKPMRGHEQFRADKIEAKADCIFVVRNRSDVSIREDDRIEWQGVEYNIDYVAESGGRAHYIELMAIRGVAQ